MGEICKYYSWKHLKFIESCIDSGRYERALKEFEIYFNNFPEDAVARTIYADLLTKLGRFDEADELFEKIRTLRDFNRVEKAFYFRLLIKLRCYQKRFKDAMDLSKLISDTDYKLTNVEEVFILKQLNSSKINESESSVYLINQILDYSEQGFFGHIEKHTMDSNVLGCCKFYDDFPLEEVVSNIKEIIPSNNKICGAIVTYTETFKYDDCGKIDETVTNYFKVVAISNTNEIITMYPCTQVDSARYTDLNHLRYDIESKESSSKIKRLSQIEKFNQKYNIC